MIILSVVGGLGIVGIGWGIGVYNTIVSGTNDYEGQWADIKTQYQRRTDLFMNLVECVKSHVKFEKSTLVELTKARAGIQNNITPKKMKQIDTVLSGLKIQVEAYPELKSNQQYLKLMEEITHVERSILNERATLNNIAEDFNTYIEIFPRSIMANILRAKKLKYFENESKTNTCPKISM